jgi:hypothetical protein
MASASASSAGAEEHAIGDVPMQPPEAFTVGKPAVDIPEFYGQFCLPLGPPSGIGNCFSELDGTGFSVRGKTYQSDGVKIEAEAGVMSLRHVEFFRHPTVLNNIAVRKGSFLSMARAAGDDRFYLVIVYQTPGKTKIHLCLYFACDKAALTTAAPPHLRRVWQRFTAEGAEEYRKSRWKVIPRIAEGAWLVSSTVGTKPALLGTKLEHTWHFGEGFAEVDCNVMSSSIASMIVSVIEGAAKNVVIDLAFAIEGREEAELPEALLGAVRLSRMDLRVMGHMVADGYGSWAAGDDALDTRVQPMMRDKDGNGVARAKSEGHDPAGWLW